MGRAMLVVLWDVWQILLLVELKDCRLVPLLVPLLRGKQLPRPVPLLEILLLRPVVDLMALRLRPPLVPLLHMRQFPPPATPALHAATMVQGALEARRSQSPLALWTQPAPSRRMDLALLPRPCRI